MIRSSRIVNIRTSVIPANHRSTQKVYRQSSFNSRNPDITGPNAGPANVIIENRAIAFPLSTGPQISASTTGALGSGALANVPVRNRPASNAPKLFAKAQRKLNAKYKVNDM
jgi:hypothetical protein